jgi:ketosteroid isomerase-like protein
VNFESEIAALEEKLRSAMLHGDLSVLDSLIADELLFVAPDGSVLGKAGDLELHRSGAQRISQLEFADLLVRARGEVAVSTVAALVAGTFNEQPFSGHFRYMRIWARTQAGWQVIAGSASPASNPGS